MSPRWALSFFVRRGDNFCSVSTLYWKLIVLLQNKIKPEIL